MKARVLIPDSLGRWKINEIATVEPSDYNKYDYKATFDGVVTSLSLFGKKIECKRLFYFYKDELEILTDDQTNHCP